MLHTTGLISSIDCLHTSRYKRSGAPDCHSYLSLRCLAPARIHALVPVAGRPRRTPVPGLPAPVLHVLALRAPDPGVNASSLQCVEPPELARPAEPPVLALPAEHHVLHLQAPGVSGTPACPRLDALQLQVSMLAAANLWRGVGLAVRWIGTITHPPRSTTTRMVK